MTSPPQPYAFSKHAGTWGPRWPWANEGNTLNLCSLSGVRATEQGVCPEHRGDACLVIYVRLEDAPEKPLRLTPDE